MKKVKIGLCLDASGSMRGISGDVIQGFNSYLADLKEQVAERYFDAQLVLLKFNTTLRGLSPVTTTLSDFEALTPRTYHPDGWTPLYDAVGVMIDTIQEQIDQERYEGGVLLIVHTDGQENESVRFTQRQVRDLVEKKEREGWNFLYIGVGKKQEQAEDQGRDLGISLGTVLSVSRSAAMASFDEISRATVSL